jgi:hypothetical protein
MPSKQPSSQPWQFLTENPQAILEGLWGAEFDHIYPASPTLFGRFPAYLAEAAIRQALDRFPEPRRRRCVPVE